MTKNGMFPLVMINVNHSLSYVKFVTSFIEISLWHLRHGHLYFNSPNILQMKPMVLGLLVIDVYHNPCEICVLSKHQRNNFTNSTKHISKSPLERVHTNLCGPMQM